MLDAEHIRGLIGHKGGDPGFFSVSSIDPTPSTNEEIKKAIRADAGEGAVVLSTCQTAGYGRQRRAWASPEGGLYLSCLLRPGGHAVEPSLLPSFGLAASLAVCDLLDKMGCNDQIKVKWPNDIVGTQGKYSGISNELVEGALCVGIGVNLFAPVCAQALDGKYQAAYAVPTLQSSTLKPSISTEGLDTEQTSFIEEAAAQLLVNLATAYQRWCAQGFEPFRETYMDRSSLMGRPIKLELPDCTVLEGVAVDVDEYGFLMIRDQEGRLHQAHSGEAHLV